MSLLGQAQAGSIPIPLPLTNSTEIFSQKTWDTHTPASEPVGPEHSAQSKCEPEKSATEDSFQGDPPYALQANRWACCLLPS